MKKHNIIITAFVVILPMWNSGGEAGRTIDTYEQRNLNQRNF